MPRRNWLRAVSPSGSNYPKWVMAPLVAGTALLLYIVKRLQNRRHEALISEPQNDAVMLDPAPTPALEEADLPAPKRSGEKIGIRNNAGPLVQFEANLSETKTEQSIRPGPAPIAFSESQFPTRSQVLTTAPPPLAGKAIGELPRPSRWEHWNSRSVGDLVISRGRQVIARLSDAPQLLGQHRILNGAALVLTAALITYVLAGGLHRATPPRSNLHQANTSQTNTRATVASNAGPYAMTAPHMSTRPPDPPPPAEGFEASPSPSPKSTVKSVANGTGNRRSVHGRQVRHRLTSFDKVRTFLRRLF